MDRPNVTASELQGELASLRPNIHATCLTQMKVADNFLHTESARLYDSTLGGLAQLGERLHGMQEVIGSSPLSSIQKPPVNSHAAFFVSRAVGVSWAVRIPGAVLFRALSERFLREKWRPGTIFWDEMQPAAPDASPVWDHRSDRCSTESRERRHPCIQQWPAAVQED